MKCHHSRLLLRARLVLVIAALLVSASAVGENTNGGIHGRVFLDENADTDLQDCDCDCGLEAIAVRLYEDRCAGLIIQTARTDKAGYFHFNDLEPGDYCVTPDIKMICEGFQPTKPITQKVLVQAGEITEAEWFAFDHFLDIND